MSYNMAYPTGPNAVTIAGGGQSTSAWLIGNASLSRAAGTSASASSGQGGWQVTDRTRRKAGTEWLDYYPFVLGMKLRFESDLTMALQGASTIEGQHVVPDVEVDMIVLESFEVPVYGSYPQEPPVVTVTGPVPHTDLFWVVSRLSFDGDNGTGESMQIRNSAGLRTMQVVTIELTEYSPTGVIFSQLTPAQQAATPSPTIATGANTITPSGRTYTVRPGDTLQSIAANILGNWGSWVNIAILNGLSNSAILWPGLVLQLPAS